MTEPTPTDITAEAHIRATAFEHRLMDPLLISALMHNPHVVDALKRAVKAVNDFDREQRRLMADTAERHALNWWADLPRDPAADVANTTATWTPTQPPVTPRPIEHVLDDIARKAQP